MKKHTFTVAHFFGGIGGAALGTGDAKVRIDGHIARFENVGGIDIDPLACEDFERLTGAPALCIDIHKLEPAALKRFIPVCPDVIMMSPPCKGFSGLLGAKKAEEAKYQKMNRLLLRAMFLCVSTWKTVPKIIFCENVPRIAARGKRLVEQAVAIGHTHGYAVAMGNHDCGEIGGLGQHRRRWFMVMRQLDQLAASVYNPVKHRVKACGEILDPMPVPGDVVAGGPMHSLPNLSWQNWVRLSLIPAGGDWRDLPGVLVEGQKKREKFRRNAVGKWDEPNDPVTGPGGSAAESVADPRPAGWGSNTEITAWEDPARAVTGNSRINGSGASAVADPRLLHGLKPSKTRHNNKYRVTPHTEPGPTVTGATHPGGGAPVVADPIMRSDRLGVTGWEDPTGAITAEGLPTNGRFAVADPRPFGNVDRVAGWDQAIGTVTHSPAPSSGAGAVADPRPFALADNPGRHWNKYGIIHWAKPMRTIIGGDARIGSGAPSVADPRFTEGKKKNWQQVSGVTAWSQPAPTITSGANLHAGAFQVGDPRLGLVEAALNCRPRGGAYKVLSWQEAASTITGSLSIDNGAAAVADPRLAKLKAKRPPPFIPVIVSADGTWHRPLTTLELAALQGFPTTVKGKPLVLAGSGHTRWRESIGNAVPPPAAQAVGEQLLKALLSAATNTLNFERTGKWVDLEETDVVELDRAEAVH